MEKIYDNDSWHTENAKFYSYFYSFFGIQPPSETSWHLLPASVDDYLRQPLKRIMKVANAHYWIWAAGIYKYVCFAIRSINGNKLPKRQHMFVFLAVYWLWWQSRHAYRPKLPMLLKSASTKIAADYWPLLTTWRKLIFLTACSFMVTGNAHRLSDNYQRM